MPTAAATPTVALLVPAYRAARYLPAFAEAARAQTVPFTEWRCHDDASGDDTAAVAGRLGFTVTVGLSNQGPSHARNRLARECSAEWIHFHDADDLFAPDYLAQALAAADPHCDVVLCDSSWELETTRERIIHWTYQQAPYDADPLGYITTHPVGVISALIRRSAFLAAGGFDESARCWEDADLFVRLAETGARFRMLERTLVTSLRHDRGISRDQHHCDHCRLRFLKGYASRQPRSNRPHIADEAEKLIARFLRHGDTDAAREALSFCRELGLRPPTTQNRLLRLLKPIVPALRLVAWQDARRRQPTTAHS